MPHWNVFPHPHGMSREEHLKLLEVRREALESAVVQEGLGLPVPVSERFGWKAYLRVLGRDTDGSLKALVVCEGPYGQRPYKRAVRLVRQQPLPRPLT